MKFFLLELLAGYVFLSFCVGAIQIIVWIVNFVEYLYNHIQWVS